LTSTGLKVEKITLVGREQSTKEEVLRALGAGAGESILHFDISSARERLVDLDWVSDASVSRLFPNHVHVRVEEKEPLAIWQQNGKLYLIDSQGTTISSRGISAWKSLPFVVGDGANEHAQSLLGTLTKFPELHERVQTAVRVGDRRWNLRLQNGVEVRLPETNLEGALTELFDLETRTRVLESAISSIDLRFEDRLILEPLGTQGMGPAEVGSDA
jgi:cell division protein FtsQ